MEQASQPAAPAAQPMQKRLPGTMDLLKEAKKMIGERQSMFFMIILIPTLLAIAGEILVSFEMLPLMIVGAILYLIAIPFQLLYTIAYTVALDKQDIKDWKVAYKESKKYFWSFIWVGILVGLATMGLSLLLLIPGVWASVAWSFATFVLVYEGKRGWDAAKGSQELVKGRWWPVFGRFIGFGLLVLVLFLVIGIIAGILAVAVGEAGPAAMIIESIVGGLLAVLVTPYAMAFSYKLYRVLKTTKA